MTGFKYHSSYRPEDYVEEDQNKDTRYHSSYRWKRQSPKRKKKFTFLQQLVLLIIMFTLAFMFTLTKQGTPIANTPTISPLEHEISKKSSDSLTVHTGESTHIKIINEGDEPLYWEVYGGDEIAGDSLDGGTVEANRVFKKDYGKRMSPATYTWLFFNGESGIPMKATFTLYTK